MDELVLLLLVARDEVEDVVDDVPPTGWPRDKPAFVYDEWDDPNGLWTEHINIHKESVSHQNWWHLEPFLSNSAGLKFQMKLWYVCLSIMP
jgi:hypothetical protein